MKRCKKCNKPLADTAQFCPTCGTPCDEISAESPGEARKARDVQGGQKNHGEQTQDGMGASAVSTLSPKPKRKKRKRKKRVRLIIVALVALIVVAVLVIVFSQSCTNTRIQSPPAPAALVDGSSDDGNAYTSQFADVDAASTKIEVPDVKGEPLDRARQMLEQAGLVVEAAAAGYDPAYADSVVLTQSKTAGEWAMAGDHIALTYNALPMTLTVFPFSPREGRITLGNLLQVCSTLDTTNPTFGFRIVIHAVEDYELKGGFRCLTGAGEETPIARVNTQLIREGKAIKGLEAENAYDDSIGWTISLDDWTGFHFDNVTGYDVSVYSREDEALALTRSYTTMDTASMTLLDCGYGGGRIRMDVAAEKQLILRLTDDKLQTGYTNSTGTAGTQTPVWEVKLPIDSYRWISVTIDGSNGETMDQMKITGARFIETQASAKNKKPTSFEGVSYTVDGDTLVIAVTIPSELDYSVYDIAWLELTANDGAFTFKTRIR